MEEKLNDQNLIVNNDIESDSSSRIEILQERDETRSKVYFSEEERKNISDSTSIVSDSSEGYMENLTDSESSQKESKRKPKKVSLIKI